MLRAYNLGLFVDLVDVVDLVDLVDVLKALARSSLGSLLPSAEGRRCPKGG
jgi:hypothetical protein